MAKKIVGAVRYGNRLYKEGDEEALAKSGVDLKRLAERGVIEGFGKSPAESKEPVVEEAQIMETEEEEKPKGKKK